MQITKKFIIIGMGITSLVAGGGAAFAATTSASTPTAAAIAPKVTAERAMEIAHKTVPGAWVSEVDYDRRSARPDVWEIDLVKGSQRHELDVDTATGRVTDHATGRDDHDGRDDDGRDDDHGGRDDDHDDD
ncbi:PepSY domain-containing protein [Nonomuraea sp. K274]|uniref:PepSY domain-containing protein n=1 Tax=Nonomuraea cypriaca TaxID=1187855 RepID=A0A931A342_9ACTN|nr:PepSY domain-containing protein [Nonomuraea cypriaca]MBF8185326.1 PepSY domain-containing protein [Nonomuraea cypriaca]